VIQEYPVKGRAAGLAAVTGTGEHALIEAGGERRCEGREGRSLALRAFKEPIDGGLGGGAPWTDHRVVGMIECRLEQGKS